MNSHDTDDWVACPVGTLARLREQFPSESRQRAIRPYATGAALGLLIAAVVFGLSLVRGTVDPAPHLKGNLLCQDVMPLLPRYHAGELPVEVAHNVKIHLSLCSSCQEKYRETYPSAFQHTVRLPGWTLASAASALSAAHR